MKILLSIKPEFARKILEGEKKFEFRKQIPKKSFTEVIIYESSPTKNIVGRFVIGKILKGTPDHIWEKCGKNGGINEKKYFEYCNGNSKIYAMEIKEVHWFDEPINPFDVSNDFVPPQNFSYIDPSNDFVCV